jgi:excisionase family DNA binding protein
MPRATRANDPLLDVSAVAERLGVSISTVRRLIENGELPAFHLGGLEGRPIRIRESAFISVLHGWETR